MLHKGLIHGVGIVRSACHRALMVDGAPSPDLEAPPPHLQLDLKDTHPDSSISMFYAQRDEIPRWFVVPPGMLNILEHSGMFQKPQLLMGTHPSQLMEISQASA